MTYLSLCLHRKREKVFQNLKGFAQLAACSLKTLFYVSRKMNRHLFNTKQSQRSKYYTFCDTVQ